MATVCSQFWLNRCQLAIANRCTFASKPAFSSTMPPSLRSWALSSASSTGLPALGAPLPGDACHGPGAVGGGSGVPDLRYSSEGVHAVFSKIVLEGLREPGGMPRFDDLFDANEVRMIQAWILEQARIASQRTAS